jgi:ABC-type sugar transport system substrate-binding protein
VSIAEIRRVCIINRGTVTTEEKDRMTETRGKKSAILIAAFATLCVAIGLGVSACGSDSSSSTGSSDSTSQAAGSTGSEQDKSSGGVPAPPTEPERGIGVSTPLTEVPQTGLTVGWLECALPGCKAFRSGLQTAAAKLGWNVETLVYKSGEPGAAMQQAVNKKVDFIAITSESSATFEQELQAANAAGIPVVSGDSPDSPEPSKGLVAVLNDGSAFQSEAKQLASWILDDSGGEDVHIGYVTIESIPILNYGLEPLEPTLEEAGCTDCSVETLSVTPEELGAGQLPAKLVSFLQTHPEVNYLDFAFPDLIVGVSETLEGAGIQDVKLVGQTMGESEAAVEGLKTGAVSAMVATPQAYQMWLTIDTFARLSVGMPIDEDLKATVLPSFVAAGPSSVKYFEPGAHWPGPPGFESEFEQLWGK